MGNVFRNVSEALRVEVERTIGSGPKKYLKIVSPNKML